MFIQNRSLLATCELHACALIYSDDIRWYEMFQATFIIVFSMLQRAGGPRWKLSFYNIYSPDLFRREKENETLRITYGWSLFFPTSVGIIFTFKHTIAMKGHREGHTEGLAAFLLLQTPRWSVLLRWLTPRSCLQVSGGCRRWACPRSWAWWRASWHPPWSPSATTTPALACRARLLRPTTPLIEGSPWRPSDAS